MRLRQTVWILALLLPGTCAHAEITMVGRYHSPYADSLLKRQTTADNIELLLTAAELDLVGRTTEARDLRDFVERRLWLAALGEPQPHATTINDTAAARWPEDVSTLRKRGAEQLLPLKVLATWFNGEPEPTFDVPADDGYTHHLDPNKPETLSVLNTRLRVTNSGARTIATFELLLDVRGDQNSGGRFSCRWHDYQPLAPQQTRDVVCRWTSQDTQLLRTAAAQLQTPREADPQTAAPILKVKLRHHRLKAPREADPQAAINLTNVSFWEAGRRVPYALDSGYAFSEGIDLDLVRTAYDRASAVNCLRRDRCTYEVHPVGLFFDLLPWLFIPALLGIVVGRRVRRKR